MSALTIVEAAKLASGDVLLQGVIETFAARSPILAALPFETIAGNALKYNREAVLPGVAFRGVNEGYTASAGVINPVTEGLVICGGDVDVDRFILQTQGQSVMAQHVALKAKAIADDWGQKFIKGDSTSDPRQFDGLQARLAGSQKVANGGTDGGDVLSLAKLDEAIDKVDEPTHIIMSKAMKRAFVAAARTTTVSGYTIHAAQEMGRPVLYYAGLPILTVDNGSTEPLGFSELGYTGSTATATSIYVVSFGPGKLVGLQNGGIDVRDLGELDSQPVHRVRIEWYAGLALYHPRAACRLYGVKTGAIVA